MNRLRMLVTIALPSIIVGGLVFGHSSGHAAAGTGDGLGYWPAAADAPAPVVVAERDKRPPRDRWGDPPPPPPPAPPPRHKKGNGVSVSIHGDRIQITGIEELVTEHLDTVREVLRRNPNIPKDVRDKLVARMDRVRAIVHARLDNLKTSDLDKLGDQLERMGEELEKALEGLDEELAQINDKVGKDLAKDLKNKLKFKFKSDKDIVGDHDNDDHDNDADDDRDNDNDNDRDDDSDSASSDDDVPVAIDDLKGFTLEPAQRDAIARLHDRADAQVAAAKKQLDDASRRLETALGDPRTSDADVVRLVDQISGQEAAIRKAKLLAWVQARRVLDADQVKKLETAAQRSHKK